MSHLNSKPAAATLLISGVLALTSCSSSNQRADTSVSHREEVTTASYTPGEAGRVVDTTFTASATVSAIDPNTRRITLKTEDGRNATITAGPEVRNFDQIKVGDRVNATILERMVVFVRSGSEEPSVTHAVALNRAPQGAKPGILVADGYEITAKVTTIDTVNRTASLQFANGVMRTVKIRPDVDLNRYQVGDTVVIRVTDTLSLLVESP